MDVRKGDRAEISHSANMTGSYAESNAGEREDNSPVELVSIAEPSSDNVDVKEKENNSNMNDSASLETQGALPPEPDDGLKADISHSELDKEDFKVEVVPPIEKDALQYINIRQFVVTLIKNTTGPGCLAIPCALSNMGVVFSIFAFILFAYLNVVNSFYLIRVTDYTKTHPSKYMPKKIGGDYASIMYHILGPSGQLLFTILYLVTIWGVQVGSMITMNNFINKINWPETFLGGEDRRKAIFHIIYSVICYFLILLSNMRQIVNVSQYSIFVLFISYITLIGAGIFNYGMNVDKTVLFPVSFGAFLAYSGVPSFSLGYNFSYMSFYKQVSPSKRNEAKSATVYGVMAITFFLFVVPLLAFFTYRNGPTGVEQNILMSMPAGSPLTTVVCSLMFLSTLLSYAIFQPPISEIVENSYKNKTENKIVVTDRNRVLIRLLQAVVISFIAYVFPYFGDIIALLGGLVMTAISLIIPAILDYICFHKRISRRENFGHFAIIISMFIFMCISTFFNTKELIAKLSR